MTHHSHAQLDNKQTDTSLLNESQTEQQHSMSRERVLQILKTHREELARDYAVKSLALFGSVARNEAKVDSDVDVLVEFSQPVGIFHFMRVQRCLQNWLGCKVDLVTKAALKEALRTQILHEAIYA